MNFLTAIKKYKNSVTRKYISITKDEIDTVDGDKWFVSKKIDGQLWFYVKEEKNSKIINSNESELTSKLKDIINELDKKFKAHKNLILAGELYYLTKDRERYGDTISGLGDKIKSKNLRFGIFDIVYSDKTYSLYKDKYNLLLKVATKNEKNFAHVIEHEIIDKKQVSKYFKDKIEKNNSEGLILRNDSQIYKVKIEETADLLVTGFTLGSKSNQVRSVSLGYFLNDNEIIHIGSCGAFDSETLRKDLFKKLDRLKITSNFQKIASNGTAYIFVKPEIVVEVKLLEMQGDKSNDQPIRHLKFEFKDNKLNATGKARSVSILNSKIINIRTDKKASLDDCGLNQIIKISGIPKEEFKEVSNKDLPKSKTLKKEIFKKEGKKGIAIRKFLFWKSNKEKISDYPSYLCYFLDYSEGRSDPIKRKLYPFEDEKLGLDYLKKLIDENIKKGWEKYSG
jgi:hypothetical protein